MFAYFKKFYLLIIIFIISACETYDKKEQVEISYSYHPSHITLNSKEELKDIADKYHVRLKDLLLINNLKPGYKLKPNQKLALPKNKYYKVKGKENINQISRMFDVDAGLIANYNGIKYPFILKKGMIIKIPANKISVKEIESLAKVDKETKKSIPFHNVKVKNIIQNFNEINLKVDDKKLAKQSEFINKNNINSKPKQDLQSDVLKFNYVTEPVYHWPVEGGRIKSEFNDIINGVKNEAIIISANYNDAVKAFASGTVIYCDQSISGEYGKLIIIKHSDGMMSAYAYLNDFSVNKNSYVKAGQKIGTVGKNKNLPELYFALKNGKEHVNPRIYLDIYFKK